MKTNVNSTDARVWEGGRLEDEGVPGLVQQQRVGKALRRTKRRTWRRNVMAAQKGAFVFGHMTQQLHGTLWCCGGCGVVDVVVL